MIANVRSYWGKATRPEIGNTGFPLFSFLVKSLIFGLLHQSICYVFFLILHFVFSVLKAVGISLPLKCKEATQSYCNSSPMQCFATFLLLPRLRPKLCWYLLWKGMNLQDCFLWNQSQSFNSTSQSFYRISFCYMNQIVYNVAQGYDHTYKLRWRTE